MVLSIIVEIWLYKAVKLRRLEGCMDMLSISEVNLKELETKTSRSLVGEVLRQIEVIEAQQLTKEESLSLLKSLVKNKIYESARNHTLLIQQFSNAVTFSIEFLRPPKA